jgi:branched-chain amino acid transport system substrate-binding protein
MKEMPTDDPLFGKGTIRVDGRKIHPAYLVEVKKPTSRRRPGTIIRFARPFPPSRPSGLSIKANVRW